MPQVTLNAKKLNEKISVPSGPASSYCFSSELAAAFNTVNSENKSGKNVQKLITHKNN